MSAEAVAVHNARIARRPSMRLVNAEQTPSAKGRKYGNTPTEVNGILFASNGEAERWKELRLMEWGGRIEKLRRQVPFALTIGAVHIGNFVADFAYERVGKLVVEDHKSPATKTPLYEWKKKHLRAQYGIEVEEHFS